MCRVMHIFPLLVQKNYILSLIVQLLLALSVDKTCGLFLVNRIWQN